MATNKPNRRKTKKKTRASSEKKLPSINGKQQSRSFLIEFVKQYHPAFNGEGLIKTLFDKQQEFICMSNREKAALCSRRAGKTRGAAIAMIEAAKAYPGEIIPYIALTRQSAKNIMWPTLEECNRLYGVGLEPKEAELSFELTIKNRTSKIMLVGADMKNFIDRLRGPKYPIAVIDEAGHFRQHIEHLVDDVLDPATADFNGSKILLGTPGPIPDGYFYQITEEKKHGFTTHHWTILDNPYFPNPKEYLEKLRRKKGWSEDHPTYIREWLGKWVLDLSSLVYKINDYNVTDDVAFKEWYYVLGIDVGYHDQTAFGLVAYSPHFPQVYVERVEGFSEMIPSEIAEYVRMIVEEYEPTNIVMDTGGLGKSIAEEMKKRYQIPIKPAEKRDKMSTIELFNGDLKDGRVLINPANQEYINQAKTLTKAENGLEDPTKPNDLADCVLYSWREAKHYCYQEPAPKIERGSQAEIDLVWQQLENKMEEGKKWTTTTDSLLD